MHYGAIAEFAVRLINRIKTVVFATMSPAELERVMKITEGVMRCLTTVVEA